MNKQEKFEAFQNNGSVHPLTCGNGHDLKLKENTMYCNECNYTQEYTQRLEEIVSKIYDNKPFRFKEK